MIMKRFLVVSLMACMSTIACLACGGEWPTHHNYLFSVFPREQMDNIFQDRINDFWKQYTGVAADDYYYWNLDQVQEAAERKGDTEMATYAKLLDQYMDNVGIGSGWGYPTKEEIAQKNNAIKQIGEQARAYQGTRLKAQYALLQMRVNMQQGKYADNQTFWEQKAKLMPASVYRDMMENIYANALIHLGQRTKACDIYARQGDMKSIKWCMRKFRNVAGIETTYTATPSSPTLRFLIQDFVNSTQETQDNISYIEWMKELDMNPVYKADIDRFIRLANRVVAEGKSEEPSLWMAAAGCLHFFLGENALAYEELTKAMQMKGTQRMRDNARAIRMVVAARQMALDKKFNKFMYDEMQWLDSKINEERAARDFYHNHYTDVKERLVFWTLAPKYRNAGQTPMAVGLIGMTQEAPIPFYDYHPRSPRNKDTGDQWNQDYSNEYFTYMDSLTATDLQEYHEWLQMKHKDAFEAYVVERVYRDNDFYNDLIGTKYLAAGRFAEAIPFLEKVSIGFLQKQNIAIFMINRSYSLPQWTAKQEKLEEYGDYNRQALTENKKLAFCREMLQLQSQYNLAGTPAVKQELAYQLASNYFQASYMGDCWFLTHYGQSCADTVQVWDKDFVQAAIDLLQESKLSSNKQLKQRSLYALAYIPRDEWCTYRSEWNNETFETEYYAIPNPSSRQYLALTELAQFINSNPGVLMPEISRCDVLKQFTNLAYIP